MKKKISVGLGGLKVNMKEQFDEKTVEKKSRAAFPLKG
jgi:hypothetical protein